MTKQITISIDFRHIDTHEKMVNILAPAFDIYYEEKICFEINLNSTSFLYSDLLLLITSTVNYLRQKGHSVGGKFIDFVSNSDIANYASRVNFFKHLNFPFQEKFTRQNPIGRFTEINLFNNENTYELFSEILQILIENNVNGKMLVALHFCLWEVLDNTLNHSAEEFKIGAGSGYVCAQYFPTKHEIRIMIADNGIGIHQALTTHPNTKYPHFDEKDAVVNCIEKGVTNSLGMGFGLWATAQMIKENKGQLIIQSGNHQLTSTQITSVKRLSKWQGTYTYLKINTNIPVDCDILFGENHSKTTSFQDFKGKLYPHLEELW